MRSKGTWADLRVQAFLDVIPCHLINSYLCSTADCWTPEVKAVRFFGMLVTVSWHCLNLQQHYCENLNIFCGLIYFTKVECVILVIFHTVAGTEQTTAAVRAGTLNAAKASWEDSGTGVPSTKGSTPVTWRTDPATAWHWAAEPAGLHAAFRARTAKEACPWTEAAAQEPQGDIMVVIIVT